jgi:hypothetical protein
MLTPSGVISFFFFPRQVVPCSLQGGISAALLQKNSHDRKFALFIRVNQVDHHIGGSSLDLFLAGMVKMEFAAVHRHGLPR